LHASCDTYLQENGRRKDAAYQKKKAEEEEGHPDAPPIKANASLTIM
jgi:hypothetical protein